MQVVIGPLTASSAKVWLDYASSAIAHMRALEEPVVSSAVLDSFEALVGEWQQNLDGDEFHWSSDEDPERVEYLVNALFHAGDVMEAAAVAGDDSALRPPEADEFHLRLVDGVLTALESQGPPHDHFAEEIRLRWGLDELL